MNGRLLGYIRQQLSKGVQKENIIQSLLDAGWKIEIVNDAFVRLDPHLSSESSSYRLSSLLIRLGLAFVFLYAAVFMTFAPEKYIIYFPDFMRELVPGYTLLHVFAVFEVILSFFLIIGRFTYAAAIVSFLTMFALTAVNLDKFSVLFRNVSIILSALALAVQTRKK